MVRLVRDKTTQTPSKTKCNDKKADKTAVKAKGTQMFLTKDTFTERLFTCVCSKSTGTQTVLPETADENPSLSKDQLPILVPVPPLEVNSDPVNEYSNLSEDDKQQFDYWALLFRWECKWNAYLRMLNQFVFPQLTEHFNNQYWEGRFRGLWWAQYSTPAHRLIAVRDHLINVFGNNCVIGLGHDVEWPPCSPDLTPCDFGDKGT